MPSSAAKLSSGKAGERVPTSQVPYIRVKLASFETESSLADCIHHFFHEDSKSYLILECDAFFEKSLILLAKFLVDRAASQYEREGKDVPHIAKEVVFLVHLSRILLDDEEDEPWTLCFAKGWHMYHIDSILIPEGGWETLKSHVAAGGIDEILSDRELMASLVQTELLPSFQRIRHVQVTGAQGRASMASRVRDLCRAIHQNVNGRLYAFCDIVQQEILKETASQVGGRHWLLPAVTDHELLELSSFSLFACIPAYLGNLVRGHLTRLIYVLESQSALDALLAPDMPFLEVLGQAFRQGYVLDVFQATAKKDGAQMYEIEKLHLGLRFPFSKAAWMVTQEYRCALEQEVRELRIGSKVSHEIFTSDHLWPLRRKYLSQIRSATEKLYGPFFSPSGSIEKDERQHEDASLDDTVTAVLSHEVFIKDMMLLYASSLVMDRPYEVESSAEMLQQIMPLFVDISGLYPKGLNVEPGACHIDIWNNWGPLSVVLTVLQRMHSTSKLTILEALVASGQEHRQRDRLMYDLATKCCALHLESCCREWDNPGSWLGGIDRTLADVKELLAATGTLELDGSLGEVDDSLALLKNFYLLRVIQDLAHAAPRNVVQMLKTGEEERLALDVNFLQQIRGWARECENIRSPRECLATVAERFLFVASECFVPTVECESIVQADLFLAICDCLNDLSSDPPIAVAQLLSLFLLQIWSALTGCVSNSDDGENDLSFLLNNRMSKEQLHMLDGVIASLSRAKGTLLEIMILDILLVEQFFPSSAESSSDGGQDREQDVSTASDDSLTPQHCTLFEAAFRNLREQVSSASSQASDQTAGDPRLFIHWYSHAMVKGFLEKAAEQLSATQLTGIALSSLNAVLGSTQESELTSHLRLYFLKCLGGDLDQLRKDCAEGGTYAISCPWLARMGFQEALSQSSLPFNFFKHNSHLAAMPEVRGAKGRDSDVSSTPISVIDVWEAAAEYQPPRMSLLREYVNDILHDKVPGAAVAKAQALSTITLTKLCSGTTSRISRQRKEAVANELNRLSTSLLCGVRSHGSFAQLAALEFENCDGVFEQAVEGRQASIDAMLMSLTLTAIAETGKHPTNLLSQYFVAPENSVTSPQTFVVGAEANSLSEIMRALGLATVTRYQCSCGFKYLVGECGHVTHDVECSCGQRLGGAVYGVPHPGQTMIDEQPVTPHSVEDEPGYIFSLAARDQLQRKERQLTPILYRMLSLFVHTVLFAHALVRRRKSTLVLPGDVVKESSELKHCWEFMRANFNVLTAEASIPEGRETILGAFLHEALRTVVSSRQLRGRAPASPEARLAWEVSFAQVSQPLVDRRMEEGIRFLAEFADHPISAFEKDFKELRQPLWSSISCSGFYRLTKPLTFDALMVAFQRNESHREEFPLVDVLLRNREKLSLISCLSVFTSWMVALRKEFNLRISRREAEEATHRDLWTRKDGSGFPTQLTKEDFVEYREAWNYFRCNYKQDNPTDFVIRDECKEITLWEMAEDCSLICSCFNHYDTGRVLGLVVSKLATFQNEFVTEALNVKVGGKNLVRSLETQEIQRATEDQFICYNEQELWESMLKPYGHVRLEYGRGCEHLFDFQRIERVILHELVNGKCIFSNADDVRKISPVVFIDETFINDKQLFQSIQAKIEQKPLPDAELIRADKYVQSLQEVSKKLLPAVEAVLFIVYHAKEAFSPQMTLLELSETWLDIVNRDRMLSYHKGGSPVTTLPLENLEALYEVLEDTISDSVLVNIDAAAYGKPFEDIELLTHTAMHVGGWVAFEHGFRRFIMRYLRRPDPINPAHPLHFYLTELVRFPRGSKDLSANEALGDSWEKYTVQQSLSILAAVRKKIQEEREAEMARSNPRYRDGAPAGEGQVPLRSNRMQRQIGREGSKRGGAQSSSVRMPLGGGRKYRPGL